MYRMSIKEASRPSSAAEYAIGHTIVFMFLQNLSIFFSTTAIKDLVISVR